MRIGVTCDAEPNEERALVARALAAVGTPVLLAADDTLPARLGEARPDIVLNLTRGRAAPERRLHVPALLESMAIPFSGSDAVTHATCVSRSRFKTILASHGIPTAGFAVISSPPQLAPYLWRAYPVAIRRAQGVDSCFATLVAHDFDELEAIAAELLGASSEPIIIERFLPGESFACSVLGNGADAATLPVVNIPNDPFAASATHASSRVVRIDHGLAEEIETLALRTFRALGCRDLARVDIRLSDTGVPNVCSVDALPEFADDGTSVRAAAQAAGVTAEELVQRFLLLAAERAGLGVASAPAFRRLARRPQAGAPRGRLTPS